LEEFDVNLCTDGKLGGFGAEECKDWDHDFAGVFDKGIKIEDISEVHLASVDTEEPVDCRN
jgi:hypothetical protein